MAITVPHREYRTDPVQVAPAWVVRTFYALRPPRRIAMKDVEHETASKTHAKQFVHVATKHHLLVSYARGQYVALDPSVAFRAPAVGSYWANLLAIHNALEVLSIKHAFACLAILESTDLVPERPWPVVPYSDQKTVYLLDPFGYSFREKVDEQIEVIGLKLDVPSTTLSDTALLLAAVSMPREVAAARQILERITATPELVKNLNSYGIHMDKQITESSRPRLRLPRRVQMRKRDLADALLRGSME